MTPNEIKSQLVLKGITYRQLARRASVHDTMITLVIQRKRKSHKVCRVIARAIDKPWQEVFSDNGRIAA